MRCKIDKGMGVQVKQGHIFVPPRPPLPHAALFSKPAIYNLIMPALQGVVMNPNCVTKKLLTQKPILSLYPM